MLAAATAGGTALTLLWDHDAPLPVRLAAGAAVGLAVLGLAGYGLASVLGFGPLAIALAAGVVAAPLALLARRELRARLSTSIAATAAAWRGARRDPWAWLRAAALILLGAVLLACFDRAFFLRADGLYTGVDHNLGDLPFHLAIVQGFAEGHRFPPEHPDLAGARLTYPFLADFVAALLVGAGAGLRRAFLLQNAWLALALLVLLHRWAFRLTGERSAAVLVPWLVFLSGGLGFTDLLRDAQPQQGGLLGVLGRLPHDYTIRFEGGLRFGNLVTTLLMPQRAFLLGLPLAILASTLIWEAVGATDEDRARRTFLAAGGVAGLLPLAHAHSFLVVVGAAMCQALLFWRPRGWKRFFAAAAVVALPVIAWMARGSPTRIGEFLGWQLGWDRGAANPVVFWIRNAGVFLVLAIVGYLWGGRHAPTPRRLRLFLAPFALCFLVPNVLKLSPWIWDNIKLLVYAYVFAAPLVALLLLWTWRRGGWSRLAALGLGAACLLSGGLDVGRVAGRQIAHALYDQEGLAFAQAVAESTPRHALIAHAPIHDTPLFLTGRRSLLGFPAHLWSQGLEAGTREADLARLYAGAPSAPALLRAYDVDYVVLGPQERRTLRTGEAFLARLPVVREVGSYRLLDARRVR